MVAQAAEGNGTRTLAGERNKGKQYRAVYRQGQGRGVAKKKAKVKKRFSKQPFVF